MTHLEVAGFSSATNIPEEEGETPPLRRREAREREQKLAGMALIGGKFLTCISERKREDLNRRSEIKNRENEKAFFGMSRGNSRSGVR